MKDLVYGDIMVGDEFMDITDGSKVIIDAMPCPHMFTVGTWSEYAQAFIYEGDKIHITDLVPIKSVNATRDLLGINS